jgi:hypothetical protein
MQSGNDNSAAPAAGVPIALKIFVIGMGVMIIFMLIVLIYKVGFETKSDEVLTSQDEIATVLIDGIPHHALDIGSDAKVRSTQMDRGILTIVVETSEGDKVVLFDIKASRTISVLDF